jgi:hypothetical protein
MTSSELELEQKDGLLRVIIPVGFRDKMWLAMALTVMLLFGTIMSLIAEFAARSATTVHAVWVIPFVMLGVIALFYLLSLLAIRSMPGSIIEFDGKILSIGSIGSERRTRFPRENIKALDVSRLPMVPVANLVIHTKNDPSVRTGVCRKRDLEIAAAQLRTAIGLKSRARK